MTEENVDTNQDQNVADDDTEVNEDTNEDDGIEIDEGEDTPTDNADESDKNSDNADESDKNSEEDDKADKTKDDKLAFAFKKKQAQLKEEKEKSITLERELQAKTQQLAELTAPKRPVVPPMPDTYDPQYDQKVAARDELLRATERYDLDIANAQNRVKENQEAVQAARQTQIKTQVDAFNSKAVALEFDQTAFKIAEKTVADTLGFEGAQLAEYLLTHDAGPSIVNYLGNNALELDKVAGLSPIDAAVYIATEVVPNMGNKESSKKISKTPKAAKTLSGRSQTKSKDPYLSGATFE